jgi:hypothetical protein
VAGAVLLRAGRRIRWVTPGRAVGAELLLGRSAEEGARLALRRQDLLPAAIRERLIAARPPGPITLGDPSLAEPSGPFAAPIAELRDRRAAREAAWGRIEPADRDFYLALARLRIQEVLADPAEVLISLAREEERVERATAREEGAAVHFLAPEAGELDAYRTAWSAFRVQLVRHHARLEQEVDRVARVVVPNLSAVVGPKVAARLIARAGGPHALARMSSSKLQLLGSRRRPGPGRTPRFGVIYRADRLVEVPPDRQGAYARSLAALAVTAVRFDVADPRDRSASLVAKRDRRVADLLRRRR